MPITADVRKYGEAVLEEVRKPLLAAVGATDLAYGQLRSQLRELPGETQAALRKVPAETQAALRRLQHDLKVQLDKLQERAQAGSSVVSPTQVRQTVETAGSQAVETAGAYAAQARSTYDELAKRGRRVVRTLRRRPEVTEAFEGAKERLGRAEERVEQAEETVTGRPAHSTTRKATAPPRKAAPRRTNAHG